MTDADVVWNRACKNLGGGIGDRHLSALLLVHNAVMSGGPGHAGDSLDAAEIRAASAACRYFRLDRLADVISELPAAANSESEELRLSDAYYELAPADSVISDAFEARYARTTGDFDPITERTFPRHGA